MRPRTILTVLLALTLAGSLSVLLFKTIEYHEGDKTYAEAEQLVKLPDLAALPTPVLPTVPDPSAPFSGDTSVEPPEQKPVYVDPYADALRSMDFTALREVNDDILGWIVVPGTKLSYPLVQAEDNDYYLNRTWRKSRNTVGAIFMDYRSSADLSDFNTLIYGHRMNNKSMFGTLKYYKDLDYWTKHPAVYITDDSGSYRYDIFAAYEADIYAPTYLRQFSDAAAKQAFLEFCLSRSVIDTGVIPTVYDRIATLSTCTGNGHDTRWVVQAVCKGEAPPEESTPEETASAQEAPPASQDTPEQEEKISQDITRPLVPEAPAIPAAPTQKDRVSQDIRP